MLTVDTFTSSAGANKFPSSQFILIDPSFWPIQYTLLANTSPTVIHCALTYNVSSMQHISFGSYVPISSSAFVGSSFCKTPFQASAANLSNFSNRDPLMRISLTSSSFTSYSPYSGSGNACLGTNRGLEAVYAAIDGSTWLETTLTDQSIASLYYSPNTWNNQAILVPIHMQVFTSNSTPYVHYIGYIEHIRYIKINNYNIGDIITLGSDKWILFPVCLKDMVFPNGSTNRNSGTIGYAIRYT
jgi:hypothetical protein